MPEAHDEAKADDELAAEQSPDEEWRLADEAKRREERTDQQINYLLRVMRDRFPNPPRCPWCGHDEYAMSDVLHLYPRVDGPFGPAVYGVFAASCTTCGYIWFFNVAAAGVFDVLERAVNGEDISEAPLPPKIEFAPPEQLRLEPVDTASLDTVEEPGEDGS